MKKILSIAAVSVFATIALSVGVNAKEDCICKFEDYAKKVKCTEMCKFDTLKTREFCSSDDIINELLKDCDVIYKDNCGAFDDEQKPDWNIPDIPSVDDNTNNKPQKPSTPPNNNDSNTSKPENENNNSNSGNISNSQFAEQIINLVNKERRAKGLPELTADNAKLTKAANTRAVEQAELFSHTRPDGSKWSTVLSEYGIKYGSAGENVAYGQRTPEEVMNAWMNSSGHRANILSEAFNEIGVGVYYKNGTYYWSQLFIG